MRRDLRRSSTNPDEEGIKTLSDGPKTNMELAFEHQP